MSDSLPLTANLFCSSIPLSQAVAALENSLSTFIWLSVNLQKARFLRSISTYLARPPFKPVHLAVGLVFFPPRRPVERLLTVGLFYIFEVIYSKMSSSVVLKSFIFAFIVSSSSQEHYHEGGETDNG